VFFYCRQ